MKSLVVLPILFVVCLADIAFDMAGPQYKLFYSTGDLGGHKKEEIGSAGGTVIGKYSYIDPNGHTREVRYRADATGFHPEGDITVDKKTAMDAAAIAALAPKAPIPATFKSQVQQPFFSPSWNSWNQYSNPWGHHFTW